MNISERANIVERVFKCVLLRVSYFVVNMRACACFAAIRIWRSTFNENIVITGWLKSSATLASKPDRCL